MSTLLSDLRFALRGLGRSPLFTIVAILSLALGIGANSAIFTLIDQILLRKLPVTRPDQLVMLFQGGATTHNMGSDALVPMYQDFQQRAEPLAEVLCRRLVPASVSIDNRTERVLAEMVSGNYFPARSEAVKRTGLRSPRRRSDLPGPSRRRVSYDYWKTRFARDPGVFGKRSSSTIPRWRSSAFRPKDSRASIPPSHRRFACRC